MNKYLVLFLIILTIYNCESDDICPESTLTTPRLIVTFYDIDNPEERKNIEARCSVAGKTLLEVLDHSSKELAGLSNCTSLVFAPNNIDRPLKHVEFVALDKDRALVITIDINGLVENKIMTVPSGITAAALIKLFLSNTSSISIEEIFSPPEIIISLERSFNCM